MIRTLNTVTYLRGSHQLVRGLRTTHSNFSSTQDSNSANNKAINPKIAHNRLFTPTEGYYWKSSYEPITVPDLSLSDYVFKNVAKWENKVAIACGITGRKYLYGKLRDHCKAAAIRLHTQYGLKRGDVVAIALPNIPEFPIALLGAIEAGLVVTTVNPGYTADEISRQMVIAKPKLIFGTPDIAAKLLGIKSSLKLADLSIVNVRTNDNEELAAGTSDFFELIQTKNIDLKQFDTYQIEDLNSLCLLPFSSGTSALPKGVMLSHSNVTSVCEMSDVGLPDERLTMPTTNDFQDVFPCVLPLYHIYGMIMILVSKLALGSKIVTLPKFSPKTYLNCIVEHKATILYVAPPLAIFLGNSDLVTKQHLENVRILSTGAAPLGAMDADRIKEKAPAIEITQAYGLTETAPLAMIAHKKTTNYATIGWPAASTEAKIIKYDDPAHLGLDLNQEGELLIRGPNVMLGYLNNPEATANAITPNGWFKTGDVVEYDTEGMFYVKDRYKELIKVKGFQVPPAELEEVFRSHPSVEEVGVIGVPHQRFGEVPKAFVVLKKGSTATEKELDEFLTGKVSEFKRCLGGIKFINELPKTQSGKILRRELREL